MLKPDPGSVQIVPDPGSVKIVPDPGSVQQAAPSSGPLTPDQIRHLRMSNTLPADVSQANKLADIMTRLGQGVEAGRLRGPGAGLHTLMHSAGTPEAYQADTRELARRSMNPTLLPLGLGPHVGRDLTPEQYEQLPGPYRAVLETLVQVQNDPMFYVGASGAARAAAGAVGERALPSVMKLGARTIGGTAIGDTALGRTGAAIHDFITPGGRPMAHAARVEAALRGPEGVRNMQRLQSVANATDSLASEAAQTATGSYNRIINKLTPTEQEQINLALHKGTIAKLPPHLQAAAVQIQNIDRAIPYLLGSKSLRNLLVKKYGYKLPSELQHFDIGMPNMPTAPRGVVTVSNFMENHLPLAHEVDNVADLERQLQTGGRGPRDLANKKNLQFLQRHPNDPDSAFIKLGDADFVADTFRRSFKRFGNSLAGKDAQTRLAQLFAPTKTISYTIADKGIPAQEAFVRNLERGAVVRRGEDFIGPQRGLGDPMRGAQAQDPEFIGPHPQPQQVSPAERLGGFGPRKPAPKLFGGSKTVQRFADVPKHLRQAMVVPGTPSDLAQTIIRLADANPTRQAAQFRGAAQHARGQEAQRIGAALGGLKAPLEEAAATSKASLFWQPFSHMGRIASLLAMHSPQSIPAALIDFAKAGAGFASPERQAEIFGGARAAGAASAHNPELSSVMKGLEKSGPAGRAAAAWYRGVGNMLWTWDAASKNALYRQMLRYYKDPEIAAFHTQQALVNYARPSAAIESLRGVSNFATWRSRLPHAVFKAYIENPQVTNTAIHAAQSAGQPPGMPIGAPYHGPNGQALRSAGLAPTEGLEPLTNPYGYARGTVRPVGKMALNLAGVQGPGGKPPSWWTYGQNPAAFAFQQLPGVTEVYSPYGDSAMQQLIYTLTGQEALSPAMKHKRKRRIHHGRRLPASGEDTYE